MANVQWPMFNGQCSMFNVENIENLWTFNIEHWPLQAASAACHA
jgi:hypothetical protein